MIYQPRLIEQITGIQKENFFKKLRSFGPWLTDDLPTYHELYWPMLEDSLAINY